MPAAEDTHNKLDFIPRVSFLPLEWRSLGAAWGSNASSSSSDSQAVTGRCSFTVRQGFDPLEQSTTGRVVEGHSDVGVAIKVKTFALALTAGNLHFRTGLDDPHSQDAIKVGENTMPSLKLTAAKEFGDCGDSFIAFSYDVKQRRPELSAAWSATAQADRATLVMKADPIMRTLTIGAGVSTPGPEWRRTYYDEGTKTLDIPQDDGERHSVWVSHTAREREWLASTKVGMRLSLHRTMNWLGDFIDYRLEEHIPLFVWRLPLTQQLYKLLVPQEDDDTQTRYPLRGFELEVVHDFAKTKPALALNKRLGKLAVASASYDLEAEEAGVSLAREGLSIGVRVGRLPGLGWKKPVLHAHVEPLSLLL